MNFKKRNLFLLFFITAIFFVMVSCNDELEQFKITFETNGGNDIDDIYFYEGEIPSKPDDPLKDNYEFSGWYTSINFEEKTRYNFDDIVDKNITLYAKWSEISKVIKEITYDNQKITLSNKRLYVNSNLEDENLGQYSFKSLQDVIKMASSGTSLDPTIIYLEPDVYWTDDYTKEEIREKDDLIGLTISQSNITLIGLSKNPEDVVIASDRGQNAGANGNFNTIAIGDGFHAYNITFGNYCNIDLIYDLDPSKNHEKRQTAITQAQVITKAPDVEVMDKWLFDNCIIVSRLNVFSRDDRPYRTYIKNSKIECNDDSLGTGYITIFENCDIGFFSNNPMGGASNYLQAFLNCRITTDLSGDDKNIYLCKNNKPFVIMDTTFSGDLINVYWKKDNLSSDTKNIVYNNKINDKDLIISPDDSQASITPDEELLKTFKINDEYNIYNLLNCSEYDEWDPNNQKEKFINEVNPWNIQFNYEAITKDVRPVLEGNNEDSLLITPIILGGNNEVISYEVSDENLLKIEVLEDNSVIVKAVNDDFITKSAYLIATADNGLTKILYFDISVPIKEAPTFVSNPELEDINNGSITVLYELSSGMTELNTDQSLVNWYRSTDSAGTDKELVATSRYVKETDVAYTTYILSNDDIGYYILASVNPKFKYSKDGEILYTSVSKLIEDNDVLDENKNIIDIDFTNLTYIDALYDENYNWINNYKDGFWYGGYYLPYEYQEDQIYSSKKFDYKEDEVAWTYSEGQSGAAGKYGFQTTTQGARLVYVNNEILTNNIYMEISLSPHKTGAQGFGSAKQYLDIFIKYDEKTKTGYGLRIQRIDSTEDENYKDYLAKSCEFTLMKYENGVPSKISESIMSTAFLPDCTIVLEIEDNVFKASVSTKTPQDSQYPSYMTHEVKLEVNVNANNFSGFGFQHTGTAGAGKSGNRTTIHNLLVRYY